MSTGPIIVVIGAASPSFTPGFVEAAASRHELEGITVRLVDIDAHGLQVMGEYTRRLVQERRSRIRVEEHADRRKALGGAAFVVLSVTAGGARAAALDLEVSARHGVVHVKGDTTGPAGIFRGLRAVPLVASLCREMVVECPGAALINLSNPLAVITRAAHRAGVLSAIGLCTAIDDMRHDIAGKLGVDHRELQLDCLGVNHFTWMTGLYCSGQDAMGLFRDKALPVFLSDLPVTGDLYREYGCFPVPGYKYASEFFSHFLGPGTRHGAVLGLGPASPEDRAEERAARDAQLAEQASRSAPLAPPTTGGLPSAVTDFIVSVACAVGAVRNVDSPNRGRIPELPSDAVVEGPVLLAGQSIRPLVCAPLPGPVVSLLARVVAEQELVVEAGLRGDVSLVHQALALDPLVPSDAVAVRILQETLAAEAEWLPQFEVPR
jgi:alpha-galactosidase